MKCDYCGKEIIKFCYSVPSGVYGNRNPWSLCTKKCVSLKVKEYLKAKKEKEKTKNVKKRK